MSEEKGLKNGWGSLVCVCLVLEIIQRLYSGVPKLRIMNQMFFLVRRPSAA